MGRPGHGALLRLTARPASTPRRPCFMICPAFLRFETVRGEPAPPLGSVWRKGALGSVGGVPAFDRSDREAPS